MGIRLDFNEPLQGHYAFTIAARSSGQYEVESEECVVDSPEGKDTPLASFRVRDGKLAGPEVPVPRDRLQLVVESARPFFREVYNALTRIGVYNINPDRLRDPQVPTVNDLLARDGSNLAAVLTHMARVRPELRHSVEEYLARIMPGIERVEIRTFGSRQMLEFVQRTSEDPRAQWQFPATSMSDGTLRALGVLVALFQGRATLVGIEEPEASLHPAAAGILLDGLREASALTQVIVTSHGPDLLDNDEIPSDAIVTVGMVDGKTLIGPIDDVSRSILRDHLYSAGELMRQNQLRPDEDAVLAGEHTRLFDDNTDAW